MFLTLKLFVADLRLLLRREPNPFAGVLSGGEGKVRTVIRVLMQLLISAVVLGLSVLVILDHSQTEETKKPAYVLLGTVVGYWLR
jgi:hypothetical protein